MNIGINWKIPRKIAFLAGGILGIIWFLLVYGVNVLDVTNDGWILNSCGDLNQHYTGWLFFRRSPWHFPLGLTDGLSSAGSVSCVYTDSIPLFAIFFKLLSPLLPETFQYIGIWGIFSFFMQGAFGALISWRFRSELPFCIAGGAIFAISPTVFLRMFNHEALSGQWILLGAICIWLNYDDIRGRKRLPYVLWSLSSVIAVLVHMYFLPMIGMVMFAYMLTDIIKTKKLAHSLITGCISIISAALAMWIAGAFHGGGSYAAGGLGMFNSNLNTFFNSMGFSRFIEPFPTLDYQGEGMGYLGLGVMLAGVIALVVVILKRKTIFSDGRAAYALPAAAVFCISFLLAVSINYCIGGTHLFTIPLPYIVRGAMSVFRASGRFIWVADYMLVTAFIAVISRIEKKQAAALLLSVCAIVQAADLSDVAKSHNEKFSRKVDHEPVITGEIPGNEPDSIVFLPIDVDYLENMELYFAFSEYAYDHDMSMSSFYLARSDYDSVKAYADDRLDELMKGSGSENILYVFLEPVDESEFPESVYFFEMNDYLCAVERQ